MAAMPGEFPGSGLMCQVGDGVSNKSVENYWALIALAIEADNPNYVVVHLDEDEAS